MFESQEKPKPAHPSGEERITLTIRMLKLVVLALCVGGMLALGLLLYPDQLNRVFTDQRNDTHTASSGDWAIFFETGSAGFAIGFHLLQIIFGKFDKQAALREIEADRIELRTVSRLIVGPIFLWGGFSLLATSIAHGVVHLAIGSTMLLYPPIKYLWRLSRS